MATCEFEGFSRNPYRRSEIFIYYSVFLKDFRRWLIILLVSNRISSHAIAMQGLADAFFSLR